jgi:hypothetical protein
MVVGMEVIVIDVLVNMLCRIVVLVCSVSWMRQLMMKELNVSIVILLILTVQPVLTLSHA